MRLNLNLKGVKISPACHIQINRQAEEQRGKLTIGQIYGALYEDQAHVTNILPYPDQDNMSSKEELEAMDRRHEEMCKQYNLDSTNIGWYAVSFKQNVWEQVEIVQYFEVLFDINQKKDNASFFLVYDYEARLIGKNPYKAYRLKDEFALKQNFSLKDLSEAEINKPFIEIPVQVQKNEIFETLMVFNKKQLLKQFERNGSVKETKDVLKDKVQSYIQTLEQQAENNKSLFEKRSKESNIINFGEYCQNLGIILKAQEQEKDLRNYEENINKIKNIIRNE